MLIYPRHVLALACLLTFIAVSPPARAEGAVQPWQIEGQIAGLSDPELNVRAYSLRSLLSEKAMAALNRLPQRDLKTLLEQLFASGRAAHQKIALDCLSEMPSMTPLFEGQVRAAMARDWKTTGMAANILAKAGLLRSQDVPRLESLFDPNRFIAETARQALAALRQANLLTREHGRRVAAAFDAPATRTREAEIANVLIDMGLLEQVDIALLKRRFASVQHDSNPFRFLDLAKALMRAAAPNEVSDRLIDVLEGNLASAYSPDSFGIASFLKDYPSAADRAATRIAAHLTLEEHALWHGVGFILQTLGRSHVADISGIDELFIIDTPETSYFALSALMTMGRIEPHHEPFAKKLLSTGTGQQKITAAGALAKLGPVDKDVKSALFPLLRDPDSNVMLSALLSLREKKLLVAEDAATLRQLFATASFDTKFALAHDICAVSPADDLVVKGMSQIFVSGPADWVGAALSTKATCGVTESDDLVAAVKWVTDPGVLGQYPIFDALVKSGTTSRAVSAQIAEMLPVGRDADGVSTTLANAGDSFIYAHPAAVLRASGPQDSATTMTIIKQAFASQFAQSELWAFAYEMTGGDQGKLKLIRALRVPDTIKSTDPDGRRDLLATLDFAWKNSGTANHPVKADVARRASQVIRDGKWRSSDVATLRTWSRRLQDAGYLDESDTVSLEADRIVSAEKILHGSLTTVAIVLAHACFWVCLLFAYPRSRPIQAIFFWNPWVRAIGGFGYVGFLLTWVPYLRRQLLMPFSDTLLADAALTQSEVDSYYSKRCVEQESSGTKLLFQDAVSRIDGQAVLLGDSGIGKTMCLKMLVKSARTPTVFLDAVSCDEGPINAIQSKLQGMARDEAFLSQIIYAGGLDVCIDGMNEASTETRSKITQFLQDFRKGNIIVATQRSGWKIPASLRQFTLLPLDETDIRAFLETRIVAGKPGSAGDSRAVARLPGFLDEALSRDLPANTLATHLSILSNPLDASIVAHMLKEGTTPRLFRVVEQQISIAMAAYRDSNAGRPFPLEEFSRAVYQARLDGKERELASTFMADLEVFREQKIVVFVSNGGEKVEPTWSFRHSRFQNWFIAQAMIATGSPLDTHIDDPRFTGAYEIMASLLPASEAEILKEQIIDHAIVSNDISVLKRFVKRLVQQRVEEENSNKVAQIS